MTGMTVYESTTLNDRALAAKKDIIQILIAAKLTPIVAVGLLEELKLKLMLWEV